MSTTRFSRVMSAINSGKKVPAINLVRENPGLAAAVSKLVTRRDNNEVGSLNSAAEAQSARSMYEAKSIDIARKASDAESTMQLFPDLELGAQILISSVISPKDMSTGEIIYTAPDGMLPPEISAALISRIKDYFHNEYKIKPLLPKLLREVLFETGSYPIAVLPESSIDDIINGVASPSMESMSEFVTADGVSRPIGFLGDPYPSNDTIAKKTTFALEAFSNTVASVTYRPEMTIKHKDGAVKQFSNSLLYVTDNPNSLKIPMAVQAARALNVSKLIASKVSNTVRGIIKNRGDIRIGTEAFSDKAVKQLTGAQIKNLVYKNRMRKTLALVRVKTAEQSSRRSIGSPLVMRLPSESVIPVHVPGNEEEHVGFFVLLDMEGNPVKRSSMDNGFDSLNATGGGKELQGVLLERANHSLNGAESMNSLTMDQGTRIYTDIVETDLKERLAKGVYGKNISIAKNSEIYRIMLTRALANQYSQLLYLPGELVTYFAYKYDRNGIGKSLLDDMRILNSLRAMTMFARTMASIKNSIGITEVKLKLDENDPDPTKTIETAMHEITKTRNQHFPIGINQPVDLVDWVQRTGYQYSFEGHPGIPDVSIEFGEKNSNYVKPDQELDDELKKRTIQGLGLSPETVDNGFSAEFATTVVANNLLLSKRVLQIQNHIAPLLSDHARKVALNDATLFTDLRAIVDSNYEKMKSNFKDDEQFEGMDKDAVVHFLTDWFVTNFELTLPQPDSITLETQMAGFKVYSEALDEALNAWISTELIGSGMSGEISNQIDNVKAIIKAHFLRKYMAENNILTELAELTTKDDDGKPKLDLMKISADHTNGIAASASELFKLLKKAADKNDKALAKLTDGEGVPDGNESDGDGSSSDDTGNSDDFDMGEGDLGEGSGLGGEEEEITDTPPEDEDKPKDEKEPKEEDKDPTKSPDKLPDLDEEK